MGNGKLTQDQRLKIKHAIAEAERKTTGEIVPVIVGRSDPYPGARWCVAISFALLVALLLYWFLPTIDPIWYLLAQIPGLALGHLLAGIDPIQKLFLSEAAITAEVQQRAFQAFSENGVSETVDHTGILIFVSRFEHRVVVLADSGINAKVPTGTWDRIIEQLVGRMHTGGLADALSLAIEECGRILSEHFPADKAQVNELPDHLVIED